MSTVRLRGTTLFLRSRPGQGTPGRLKGGRDNGITKRKKLVVTRGRAGKDCTPLLLPERVYLYLDRFGSCGFRDFLDTPHKHSTGHVAHPCLLARLPVLRIFVTEPSHAGGEQSSAPTPFFPAGTLQINKNTNATEASPPRIDEFPRQQMPRRAQPRPPPRS